MYHSLTFGEGDNAKNTWDDWHLIPTSRPTFAFPEVKTHQVDIPGGNGVIDLTSSLTGYPTYNNRKGSFEFIVMHSGLSSDAQGSAYDNASKSAWQAVYSEIANYLHGQYMHLSYEDDPEYYYKGRFTIDEWNSNEEYSTITIGYDLEPFKYSLVDINNKWEWDTFNFRTGVIRSYSEITYAPSKVKTLVGTLVPVVPTISCSVDSIITVDNVSHHVNAGEHTYRDLIVYPGSQDWTFSVDPSSGSTSGSASVYFRLRSI